MHQLFHSFACYYDQHTPPDHYQHDHQLVLDLASERPQPCRMLDIGCGTGVLVAKARAIGVEAYGLDASEGMIAEARDRAPLDAVRVQRMQDLDEVERYDFVTSLSWSIHYCQDQAELADVLARIHRALRPGGILLLQVAHAPNLGPGWGEDREPGPNGEPGDITLRYRFQKHPEFAETLLAEYEFRYESRNEQLHETHVLRTANLHLVAALLESAGFRHLEKWDSWRRDPFSEAGSGWILAHKPEKTPVRDRLTELDRGRPADGTQSG